jgi:hypothetical protein
VEKESRDAQLTPLPKTKGSSLGAVQDLMDEVSRVRSEVSKESKWMQGLVSSRSRENDAFTLIKRRRLMFLFLKDLSHGVSGGMLSTKAERDSSVATSRRARLDGVSPWVKMQGWVLVGVLDSGMLFYVFLFAMRQTHSRQSAWFQSFMMWLGFDFFVAATAGVVFTHLLLPLYVLADVSKLKEKVLGDLMAFREKYLERESAAPRDLEEGSGSGTGPGCGSRAASAAAVSVSGSLGVGGEEKKGAKGEDEGEKRKEDPPSFNAAKYLFVSWRVASLCRELPESRLVLEFSTPWPKKRFGVKKAEVAKEYDQDMLFDAVTQVVVFFLASLLRCHVLVQDMIVQTVCNSGLGLLAVGLVGLYAIHPVLLVAVLVGLFVLVCYLVRIASGKHSELRERLESVTASKPEQQHSGEPPPRALLNPQSPPVSSEPSVSESTLGSNEVQVLPVRGQEAEAALGLVLEQIDEQSSSEQSSEEKSSSDDSSGSDKDSHSNDDSSGSDPVVVARRRQQGREE